MRIYLFYLSFLFGVVQTFAQLNVKTYYENVEHGSIFYVDNNESCPVSIKINLKLENMSSSNGNNEIFIVPASTKRFKLTTLKQINKKKKYRAGGSTKYNYGDHFLKAYDSLFVYNLPFSKGESYILCQGYNGSFSHQDKNQLDFKMPIGTKIAATRDGLVIKVVDVFNKNCGTQDCEKYNNLIYIYHKDGTIAEYLHLKRKSAKVRVGDQVKQGQTIAESGNVGWSTGPHLHFSVFLQRLGGKRDYIKTKFKLGNREKKGYLIEKEKYFRN